MRVSSGVASAFGATIAASLALASTITLRRFVVDDAWIPVRYAAHLAAGLGYRFQGGGDVTDGVTPLLWAPWLALLHALGAPTFEAARLTSAVAMVAAAALVGAAVGDLPGARSRFAPLVVFGAAPIGAWASGGLETGVVVLLVALGVTARRDVWSVVSLGLAASFRPECLPMVAVLALGADGAWSRRLTRGLLACLPFIAVACVRLACFGRPVPLSAIAKPADMAHGGPYVIAGLLLLGAPAFVLAPRALVSPDQARARLCVAAVAVHALAVAWAGGDWMPLSRLLLPAVPPLVLAGTRVAATASMPATLVRSTVCVAALAFAWSTGGRAAMADIAGDRASLVRQGKTALAARHAVAALDIGWVSAAFPGRVVDLAGLTDPAIAVLPGGHTSKRVPVGFLDDRGVDTLVFLRRRGCIDACVRPDGGPFERAVEERLADERWTQERFEPTATIAAGPLVYVLLTRR